MKSSPKIHRNADDSRFTAIGLFVNDRLCMRNARNGTLESSQSQWSRLKQAEPAQVDDTKMRAEYGAMARVTE